MKDPTEENLTAQVEAACRQAAWKVIKRAKAAGTPVIVWEDGAMVKLDPSILEERMKREEGR